MKCQITEQDGMESWFFFFSPDEKQLEGIKGQCCVPEDSNKDMQNPHRNYHYIS